MSSWPFKLQGQVFNGMEIVSMSHMDVEDEVVTDDMRKVSLEQGDVDRYVSRELEDWDTINWVTWID